MAAIARGSISIRQRTSEAHSRQRSEADAQSELQLPVCALFEGSRPTLPEIGPVGIGGAVDVSRRAGEVAGQNIAGRIVVGPVEHVEDIHHGLNLEALA